MPATTKVPHRLPRVGPNTKTIPSNPPTGVLHFKSLDPSLRTHVPAAKPNLPRLVRPRLAPFRSDPRRMHTRSRALAQLLTTEYDAHIINLYNPDSLRAQDPEKWERSFANEIGRLASGVGDRMPSGNEHIFFIPRAKVPTGRKVTYANPVCDYRPLKDDPYRIRLLTVGGDKLPYANDAGSPAASLLEAKLLFNSVISTPGAKFISADIKNYFLCSPMKTFEYIKIPFRWIPEEIRQQYNLYDLVEPDGYVYCEVRKGMYGLKQAARLAFDNLIKLLAPDGYYPVRESPGLWKHKTRSTVFTLCVDDFGIKYASQEDADHLISSIHKHFKCSVNWEGKNYLGLTLNWNYTNKRYIDVSMPGYIKAALKNFQWS